MKLYLDQVQCTEASYRCTVILSSLKDSAADWISSIEVDRFDEDQIWKKILERYSIN
jgi:hypothetical protein